MNYKEQKREKNLIKDVWSVENTADHGLLALWFCSYDDIKHVLIESYTTADTFWSRVVIKYENFDEVSM